LDNQDKNAEGELEHRVLPKYEAQMLKRVLSRETKTLVYIWISGYCVLGVFAILRKAAISFVMSVCQSVRMEQLGSDWKDFDKT
jgi:hypothetical protein